MVSATGRRVGPVAMLGGLLLGGCELGPEEELGAAIFHDMDLSLERNQSCATCHGREVGGTGPTESLNQHGTVYEGSVAGRFGNRKPNSTTYATLAPRFDYDPEQGEFFGGSFWDGRATGWVLGSAAVDQAQGPFLNPLEQALPDAAEVVARVCAATYGPSFRSVWGDAACEDPEEGFAAIARSVAGFEGSVVISPFDAKYDAVVAGRATLDAQEEEGFDLFQGRAGCAECHVVDQAPAAFTDFGFDNLGYPRNPDNPFYDMDQVLVDGEPINPMGAGWVDLGLAAFVETLALEDSWRSQPHVTEGVLALPGASLTELVAGNRGKHRVPTLRNVDRRPTPEFVKAYGHNGYFKTLKGLVHFYNTRDVLPRCDGALTDAEALAAGCWPAPEVEENVNTEQIGDLGLSDAEEDAIVAFLGALSDGWSR